MFLRNITRRSWLTTASRISKPAAQFASSSKPPFPTIASCPSPTCNCAEMPSFPEGLEIDHSKPLNGTMPIYSEQLLICTGSSDWMSRIEEENSGDNLAADIKELMGRGGIYSDPYNNVSITNSSFPPSPVPPKYPPALQSTSAYILPSFKYVPFLPRISFDSVQALVQGFLLPPKLHSAHDGLSPIHRDRLTRNDSEASKLLGIRDVEDVLVLICGHGGRDLRCGVLGPVLEEEFKRLLKSEGLKVMEGPIEIDGDVVSRERIGNGNPGHEGEQEVCARVGLISHIGGHKFAGNVIIYIPPTAKGTDGTRHQLAGCGIWYGRVTPNKVEGIVTETIRKGKVIEDLFRGGIKQGGEIMMI